MAYSVIDYSTPDQAYFEHATLEDALAHARTLGAVIRFQTYLDLAVMHPLASHPDMSIRVGRTHALPGRSKFS